MAGGGGLKKVVLNYIVDNPAKVYLAGGAFLYAFRRYETQKQYNQFFGKFDFQRRLERNELN